jgi:hypothetical protein
MSYTIKRHCEAYLEYKFLSFLWISGPDVRTCFDAEQMEHHAVMFRYDIENMTAEPLSLSFECSESAHLQHVVTKK